MSYFLNAQLEVLDVQIEADLMLTLPYITIEDGQEPIQLINGIDYNISTDYLDEEVVEEVEFVLINGNYQSTQNSIRWQISNKIICCQEQYPNILKQYSYKKEWSTLDNLSSILIISPSLREQVYEVRKDRELNYRTKEIDIPPDKLKQVDQAISSSVPFDLADLMKSLSQLPELGDPDRKYQYEKLEQKVQFWDLQLMGKILLFLPSRDRKYIERNLIKEFKKVLFPPQLDSIINPQPQLDMLDLRHDVKRILRNHRQEFTDTMRKRALSIILTPIIEPNSVPESFGLKYLQERYLPIRLIRKKTTQQQYVSGEAFVRDETNPFRISKRQIVSVSNNFPQTKVDENLQYVISDFEIGQGNLRVANVHFSTTLNNQQDMIQQVMSLEPDFIVGDFNLTPDVIPKNLQDLYIDLYQQPTHRISKDKAFLKQLDYCYVKRSLSNMITLTSIYTQDTGSDHLGIQATFKFSPINKEARPQAPRILTQISKYKIPFGNLNDSSQGSPFQYRLISEVLPTIKYRERQQIAMINNLMTETFKDDSLDQITKLPHQSKQVSQVVQLECGLQLTVPGKESQHITLEQQETKEMQEVIKRNFSKELNMEVISSKSYQQSFQYIDIDLLIPPEMLTHIKSDKATGRNGLTGNHCKTLTKSIHGQQQLQKRIVQYYNWSMRGEQISSKIRATQYLVKRYDKANQLLKLRPLEIPNMETKIAGYQLSQQQKEIYDPLSTYQYAIGKGQGTIPARKKFFNLIEQLKSRQMPFIYVLILDAEGGFNRIPQQLATEVLGTYLEDAELLKVSNRVMFHDINQEIGTSRLRPNKHILNQSNGIPQGSPISPEIYCLCLDAALQQVKLMGWIVNSYMDDLAIIIPSQQKLEWNQIQQGIKQLEREVQYTIPAYTISSQKTQMYSLKLQENESYIQTFEFGEEPGVAFKYLGTYFNMTTIRSDPFDDEHQQTDSLYPTIQEEVSKRLDKISHIKSQLMDKKEKMFDQDRHYFLKTTRQFYIGGIFEYISEYLDYVNPRQELQLESLENLWILGRKKDHGFNTALLSYFGKPLNTIRRIRDKEDQKIMMNRKFIHTIQTISHPRLTQIFNDQEGYYKVPNALALLTSPYFEQRGIYRFISYKVVPQEEYDDPTDFIEEKDIQEEVKELTHTKNKTKIYKITQSPSMRYYNMDKQIGLIEQIKATQLTSLKDILKNIGVKRNK